MSSFTHWIFYTEFSSTSVSSLQESQVIFILLNPLDTLAHLTLLPLDKEKDDWSTAKVSWKSQRLYTSMWWMVLLSCPIADYSAYLWVTAFPKRWHCGYWWEHRSETCFQGQPQVGHWDGINASQSCPHWPECYHSLLQCGCLPQSQPIGILCQSHSSDTWCWCQGLWHDTMLSIMICFGNRNITSLSAFDRPTQYWNQAIYAYFHGILAVTDQLLVPCSLHSDAV